MSQQVDRRRQKTVVIAIDLGMTFSAVAWAVTTVNSIKYITTWPGSKEISGLEAPTEISYLPGLEREMAWGFQTAPGQPRYRWFKASLETPNEVLLTSDAYLVPWINIHGSPHAPNLAVDIVSDYLQCVRAHTENVIIQSNPSLINVPKKYIIAVPPGWSDASRSRALACAENAGMVLALPHPLSEPLSGAVYRFWKETAVGVEGNTYIFCDAGGRTVDLISIIYHGNKKIPSFTSAGPGNQGNVGSTLINSRFEQFLKETLGDYPGWSDEAFHRAMEHFEWDTKRNFSGDDHAEFKIPVPGMANNKRLNIENAYLKLYGAELRKIIGPVVDEVVSLVMRQIDDTRPDVSEIILVGGFAENPFLYNSIRLCTPRFIPVSRPRHASIAVAAGALVMGLHEKLD